MKVLKVRLKEDYRSVALPDFLQSQLPPQQAITLKIWKHHRLSQYRRLVALVLLVNLAVFVYGMSAGWGLEWGSVRAIPLNTLANLVIINIGGAILIRQQYIVNALFRVALSTPLSWPLWLRWGLGKVAHYGGLHSGGNVAGTLWFGVLTYVLSYRLKFDLGGASQATLWVTCTLLTLLLGIIIMALPPFRKRFHDEFEFSHRFGGWTALGLFWVQMVLVIRNQHSGSLVQALGSSLGFWLLLIVTFSIILPWLRLRRVSVDIERPSSHVAILRLEHGPKPAPGSTYALAHHPLSDWHSFANIATDEPGHRMVVSRAGDWTSDLIDNPPSHLWIKGIPTLGVSVVSRLFRRVVWVVTGSGIGPTLPLLLSTERPVHLVWATRSPRKTYGDALVDEVLAAEPSATLWDTNKLGRPDLVRLACEAAEDFDAEAVVCISNQKLTRLVVYDLESRGVPAYGAIWDS